MAEQEKSKMEAPQSSDIFVVVPPFTEEGNVIFGKNSDRPRGEVQEVVYIKGGIRPPNLQCMYLMIDQHPWPINSVILSKPAWMWGAEMGSNDKNVAIGNVPVYTKYNCDDGDARIKRLLGTDFVRLGLERGRTADEALDIITMLLERYGQGGTCSELGDELCCHNSFIIADDKGAWVLETSGNFWVAEKVAGYRNLSNGPTISTCFEKNSADLLKKTKQLGLWDGQGPFDFSKIFGVGDDADRENEGLNLLSQIILNCHFNIKQMMKVLRQKDGRICRSFEDPCPTMASQVSRLSSKVSVHFFTATPDTTMSYFKPFIFTENAAISEYTTSSDEPLREHYLYRVHQDQIIKKNDTTSARVMFHMEQECVADLEERIDKIDQGTMNISVLDNVMKECVDAEITQYMLADEMTRFSI